LQLIATQISDFRVKILEVATGLQLIATKIATVATGIATVNVIKQIPTRYKHI